LQAVIGEAALWIPPKLWCFAAENQPDGDFTDFSAKELALSIGYVGDADRMLEALQQASFMDGMRLHDWIEHNGYHSVFADRAKKAAKARWKKERTKERKDSTRQDIDKIRGKHCYKHQSSIATSIPPNLLSVNGFDKEWETFRESRKKKGAKMTERDETLILSRLSEQPTRAIEAVQEAIMRNWTGFKWDWMENRNGNGSKSFEFLDPKDRQRKVSELKERKKEFFKFGNKTLTDKEKADYAAICEQLKHYE